MNIQDFRYMWRGQPMEDLSPRQVHVLAPIDKRGSGHERALLLLHGFSSSPAVFRAMLPHLSAYDAVVCPALPGHAESIVAFSKVKASDWVLFVEQMCGELVKTYASVDVLGLSLGGLLACHLSRQFKLNHLYLLAPALKLRRNIPLFLSIVRVLHQCGFRYFRNHAGNLHANKYHELTYRQLPLTTIMEILTFIQAFDGVLPTCPTDVFLGRFDEVVDSERMAEQFASLPNATLHWLEHSAHVLPLDGDIEVMLNCINARLP